MPDTRVSVIIPTFDRIHFLPETIRSVLAQIRPVDEILIIDDGSSPSFQKQLQAIVAMSASTRLIRLPRRQGVSRARNHGISMATGDYLLFLDDDDTLHPLMVEAGLPILEADGSIGGVFCLSAVRHVLSAPRRPVFPYPLFLLFTHERLKALPVQEFPFEPLQAGGLQNDLCHTLLRSNIAIHSCLLRKSAIGSARFPEGLSFGEDKHFWLQLARQGCRFELHQGVYAVVRRHAMNHSGGPWREKAAKQLEYYEKLLQDGLLTDRRSLFLVYLKLFHIRFLLRRRQNRSQIEAIFQSPRWILMELMALCRRRLQLKWRFLRHCLAKGRWAGSS